jgi:hypothetical protein
MSAEATGKRASLLQKLKRAKMTGTGNNFRDGKYRACVKSMGFKDGHKGTRYQIEFVIMSSQKVAVVSPKTGQALDITPNSVGSTADWLCVKLDKDDEPGQGNLKRCVLELVGAPEATDDDYMSTLAELSDLDDNGDPLPPEKRQEPGKGMCIDVETVRIETVRNKKEIVILKFTHVPETQYDQAAMIKWMDQIAMFNDQQQAQLPAATATA